jgi:hypothetical protein
MHQRHSGVALLLASATARVCAAVTNAWRTLISDQIGVYRPEAHYMRGPGPKWRERHADDRLSSLR